MSLKSRNLEQLICETIVTVLILAFVAMLTWGAFHVGKAEAQELCVAPYGLQNKTFKYGVYKENLAGVTAYRFVFLWNSFGTFNDYLNQELRSPQTTGVVGIVVNENCAKKQYGPKGRCAKYETLYGMNSQQFAKKVDNNDPLMKGKLQAGAKSMCSFINGNILPGKTRALSPLLETELTRAQFSKVASWMHEVLDCVDYEIIYNPLGGNPGEPQLPATVAEGHGPSLKFISNACMANLDGSPPEDGDFAAYAVKYATCNFGGCLWDQNHNLLNRGSVWMHPRARKQTDVSGLIKTGRALFQAQEALKPAPAWTFEDDASVTNCNLIIGTGLENPFSDGLGGLIYKDSHVLNSPTHKGTVLFPARFKKLTSLGIFKEGSRILKVRYAKGTGFPDQAAGNKLRPIYRFDRHLINVPYNIVIKGKAVDGRIVCYRIHNSKTRND